MKTLPVLVLSLTLLTVFSETSPILMEKQAKQLLRSRRQDRPSKPGFPDEPMRVLIKSRGASVRSGMEHGFPAQYQCWIRFLERPRDAVVHCTGVLSREGSWSLKFSTSSMYQALGQDTGLEEQSSGTGALSRLSQ
nr:uncharacterized protein C17orf67 homolog isoform X1 [Macaca fascicularis]